jgi:hypothetical protein
MSSIQQPHSHPDKMVDVELDIDNDLYSEVLLASAELNVTVNEFINEAIRAHLKDNELSSKRDLSETLRILNEYREKDPHFEEAIRRVADAETQNEDPAEGRWFRTDSKAGNS